MAKVIPGKDWHSPNRAMRGSVKKGSTIYTDDAPVFKSLSNLGNGKGMYAVTPLDNLFLLSSYVPVMF